MGRTTQGRGVKGGGSGKSPAWTSPLPCRGRFGEHSDEGTVVLPETSEDENARRYAGVTNGRSDPRCGNPWLSSAGAARILDVQREGIC